MPKATCSRGTPGYKPGDERVVEREIQEAFAAHARDRERVEGMVVSQETRHIQFVATLSHALVGPGTRMSIAIDVVPRGGIHVYAPGTPYRAAAITLRPNPCLRVHTPVYPKPSVHLFEPLNEQVLVYSSPFRIVLDVTAGDTDAQRAELRTRSWLDIEGTFDYQACDSAVCYLPVSIPLKWTVKLQHSSV